MTVQLQSGVHLTVIPTEKYKTIRVFCVSQRNIVKKQQQKELY